MNTSEKPADFHVWEGLYESFAEAKGAGAAFSGDIFIRRTRDRVGGELKDFRDQGVLPPSAAYPEFLLPIVVGAVRPSGGGISILDFGGGMANAYLPLLATLPDAAGLEYCVLEQPAVCAAGQEVFANISGPAFHSDFPDRPQGFDIVFSSSALHYVEDWKAVVARLAGYRPSHLLFSDVLAGDFPTYVTLQNYYGDKIPGWFWNMADFVAEVEQHGYHLAFKAPLVRKILGREGKLPMENLPPDRRLDFASHLLFVRQ